MTEADSFVLFSGTSHPELSKEIAKDLSIKLGDVQIEKFPDGEIGVQILENVRGKEVFILQSIAREPNLYLMELLILIDAMKRASAKSITAVMPYYGYSRQDRKEKGRVPITAKLVANLLEKAGVSRVLTMDLHADQIQGFFDVPVDNLYARVVFADKFKQMKLENPIVVSPDIGSIRLARALALDLGLDLALIDKRRVNANEVQVNALIGEIEGQDVILVDDICSTAKTLKSASDFCKKSGAKKVVVAVSHGLFDKSIIDHSSIDSLFVTNSIPLPKDCDMKNIHVVSIAKLFANAIDSIARAKSISSLCRSL